MFPIADKVSDLEESEKSISLLQQHDSACPGLGNPDSLLPPSEPPDIKNWFSSYEYESLVLETNDNFGFSESQGYKEEFMVENSRDFIRGRGGKNDGMMERKTTTSSRLLIKCNQSEEENQISDVPNSPVLSSEAAGIDKWFSSYVYESPAVEDVKERMMMMECCSNGKRKEGDDCNQSLDNGSTKKKSPVGSRFVEIIKVKDEANGFVSVKRKREDNELKASSSFVGVGICKNKNKKKKKDERKTILADVTNIEMTGKWKCPQKGKPEIGPPLKQLRLGQWFHHV